MLKSHDKESQKIILLVLIIILFGLILLIKDYLDTQKNYDGVLARNEAGEGTYSEKLIFEAGEFTDEIEIDVSDIRITKEQAKGLFAEAKVDIDTRFLGENESTDHVVTDLNFEDMYANGLVEARWQLDNYEVVNMDGSIVEDKTSADGTVVNATVFLSCGNYEEVYSLAFMVYEPDRDSPAGFLKALKKRINDVDEETAETKSLLLPDVVDEKQITWKKPMDFRGLEIIVLGIVSGTAILIGRKKDEKKKEELLIKKKVSDYPEIVANLSILMGAGISFKGTLERMCRRYVSNRDRESIRREGYEELLITYHEIKDGVGEIEAIENMGKRSGCKEYRKLSTLLSQNLRKGSKDLLEMLEKEEVLAFELRKQLALKAGEEASTKLLLPLLGMLGIVIVILIVPATMQMNM